MSMSASFRQLTRSSKADRDGSFREDLFHRLAVVPVRIPSVSETGKIFRTHRLFMEQLSITTGMPKRLIATTPWRSAIA